MSLNKRENVMKIIGQGSLQLNEVVNSVEEGLELLEEEFHRVLEKEYELGEASFYIEDNVFIVKLYHSCSIEEYVIK